MSTVIDQFVIKVKLDTSEYEAGQKKLRKESRQTKEDIQNAAQGVGAALQSISKNTEETGSVFSSVMGKGGAIGIAIGSLLYAGVKLDDKLTDIARGIRQVGIDGKNFNTTAANLRNLQNVAEMAGGSLEDAQQSVGGLAQSLYNLKFNGQVSESIRMVGRLGVNFTDSYGKAREFNDVLIDIADSLDRQKASGRMTQSEAYFAAGQAGLTGGLQTLASNGGAAVRSEIARQGGRNQITDETFKNADSLMRARISLGQGVVATAGIGAVNRFGGTRAGLDETLEGTAKNATEALGEFTDTVSEAAKALYGLTGGSMEDRARALIAKGKTPVPVGSSEDNATLTGVGKYGSIISAASKKYGVPAEVLTGIIRTESNFNPAAINAGSGAVGIGQITPIMAKQLGITPGIDPAVDIDGIARAISTMRDLAKGKGLEDDMATRYAVDAYHTGMTNIALQKNIGPESMAYAGKVLAGTKYANVEHPWMPDAPSAGKGGDVNINGDINVHTQATDANGVANGIAGALTRNKQLAANAEPGGQ